jgi:phosphotransferase system enzyme I (PtsI)
MPVQPLESEAHAKINSTDRSEKRISALAVSHGIAIGPAVFWRGEKPRPLRLVLDDSQIESEAARLRNAGSETIRQIKELGVANGSSASEPVSNILDVHLSIIEESSFIDKVESVIRTQKVNAEWALAHVSAEYIQRQAKAAGRSFSEKSLDIADVTERILKALVGSFNPRRSAYEGAVIIASELRPSTVVELAKNGPAALITDRAGWTSHTSILARELKLPMVSGIRNLAQIFAPGVTVIVDAVDGEVFIDPMPLTIDRYATPASEGANSVVPVEYIRPDLTTTDGTPIIVRANVDSIKVYQHANDLGARGIGLYRSESLIKEPDVPPTEDDQLSAYIELAEVAGDDGVKIRTFDIESGDGTAESDERNPALGLRSIRLSLVNEDRFRTQLRAILQAAFGRRVDIVLPMISGVGEVIRSKEIISEEYVKLKSSGTETGEPKIGAMIEVPSSVLTVKQIAKSVDFLCLGTNDLVQYLLAVDRDNDAVADWYETLHPAVIQAVSLVLDAAEFAHIPVTVCGEMAGSPFYVPLLLGLGARELSMNVNSIHRVRRLIAGISVKDCRSLVDVVRSHETATETESYLRLYYRQNWSHLFPPGLLESRHR